MSTADQPLTLAVTSSTGAMGVALGRSVTDAIEVEVLTDRRHAEEMSPRLQEVLDRTGVSLKDIERLVVDIGPGRFTGLRVGLATVRALAFALDVPVVGLTSLAILGAGYGVDSVGIDDSGAIGDGVDNQAVTAVIDARRAEVFQQSFVAGVPVGDPQVGPPEVLAKTASGVVVGDGVDRYIEHYEPVAGVTVAGGRNPSAAAMLSLAGSLPGVFGTDIQPLYLRDPDAKPNIKTRQTATGNATPKSSS